MLKGVFALKQTALDMLSIMSGGGEERKKKKKKSSCRDETQIKVEMF